ncbi:MAG: NTP transferase domain-containing protein [Acidobacteriia bacterium]|nr:NTP transferase domain-containing protein [Terriglobia bacterium]
MMAVILAGGKGTRLKPFTMTIPKPLLPLGDVPILEIVIGQLVASGVSRIVLTLGYMPQLFMASIGNGDRWGIAIESILEHDPMGTAGSLRLVKDLDENFLVLNGDLLTTIDYRMLFDQHLSRKACATIALSRREVHIDYGVVRATNDGFLAEYIEKPSIPYSVSMGINVLSRKSLDFIPPVGKFDMPDLMRAISASGRGVVCYETDCYWKDIGRFDDYQQASEDFVNNPARFLPKKAVAHA